MGNLEERVSEKIKESIGDLITGDELSELILKSVDDIFFKPTTIQVSQFRSENGPSLLHSIVREIMDEHVKNEVQSYIVAHPEVVTDVVETIVKNGFDGAVINALRNVFSNEMSNFEFSIQNKIEQEFMSRNT